MTKQDALDQGAHYYCLQCMTAYVHIPKYWDDRASCEGAYRVECSKCGCDLILNLKDDKPAYV
jgi:hypothetical protein